MERSSRHLLEEEDDDDDGNVSSLRSLTENSREAEGDASASELVSLGATSSAGGGAVDKSVTIALALGDGTH